MFRNLKRRRGRRGRRGGTEGVELIEDSYPGEGEGHSAGGKGLEEIVPVWVFKWGEKGDELAAFWYGWNVNYIQLKYV